MLASYYDDPEVSPQLEGSGGPRAAVKHPKQATVQENRAHRVAHSKAHDRLLTSVTITAAARRKLDQIAYYAQSLDDLRVPPGNRLEALTGDLAGYHSIRINNQGRVIFRWEGADAFDVQIADYHR